MKTPQEIVSLIGGTVRTAEALQISPQAVSNWLRRGSIPLSHVSEIVSIVRNKGGNISYKDLME